MMDIRDYRQHHPHTLVNNVIGPDIHHTEDTQGLHHPHTLVNHVNGPDITLQSILCMMDVS